ncbi:tRNA dihydrouridine synthase DusB [bacterium]|nr:tRNA dihydrouridine synthase DusB [bacterium]
MSGVTDAPFRAEVVRFGAQAVVSEMVAGEELARGSPEFVRRAARHEGGGPFILQLAAREPHWLDIAARLASDAGADVLDLNMGCPAKRVTGGQSGSALMREPDLVRRLVQTAVAAFGGPVTVKMRLGWDDSSINAPDIARIAVGEGARLVTVHGRTRNQFYKGEARWRAVRDVVEAVQVPVIVNGDVKDAASAREAIAQSGAAGVMIGRAAVGRPWLINSVARALGGIEVLPPSLGSRVAAMVRQVHGSLSLYGTGLGVRVVRKHLSEFVGALPEVDQRYREGSEALATLRGSLCRMEDPVRLLSTLEGLAAPEAAAA